MQRRFALPTCSVLLLLCGMIAGCGNNQAAGDNTAVVEGNAAARSAWEKAKADGSLKNRVNKPAADAQHRRGH